MTHGPLLIVEDSDADFYAMKRALRDTLHCEIMRCNTGKDALDYMFRRGTYAEAVCPPLILLDINLPGTDGRSVLAQLKQDPVLKKIPVVMVSTSDNPADITFCYTAGCSGYLVKPLDFDRLVASLQTLCKYWFNVVTLPQI